MVDLATTVRQNLRIDEFTEIFDVSRRTVYNWRVSGKIQAIQVGGTLRIPVSEARRLAANRVTTLNGSPEVCKPGQPPAPGL